MLLAPSARRLLTFIRSTVKLVLAEVFKMTLA